MATPYFRIAGPIDFTFNDGDVESISSSINPNIEHEAMPGMDALSALLYDFNGVSKIITISGKLSNSGTNRLSSGSAITIDEQRKWIEKQCAGAQTGLVFSSNYSGSYDTVDNDWHASSVMIGSIEWTEVTGEPASLQFRIVLFVGDV